jgi:hypothetical protein
MDINNKDFSSIEKKLDSFLRPVNPEESFASNLKLRLLNEPGITIEKPDYLFVLLFICSLFFIGVLMIWLLNRIFNKQAE